MLRVDKQYRVLDKDRANGFILFEFPGEGTVKQCTGSLELVESTDGADNKVIQARMSIAHQPSYVEIQLLDKLERKLYDEQGPAPEPARKPPKQNKKKKPEKKPSEPGAKK